MTLYILWYINTVNLIIPKTIRPKYRILELPLIDDLSEVAAFLDLCLLLSTTVILTCCYKKSRGTLYIKIMLIIIMEYIPRSVCDIPIVIFSV